MQGTYYGDQSGAGHCSFQFSNSFTLPWTTGVYTGVAVNAPQYSGSAPCGMCIAFWGTGPGDLFCALYPTSNIGSKLSLLQVQKHVLSLAKDHVCPQHCVQAV